MSGTAPGSYSPSGPPLTAICEVDVLTLTSEWEKAEHNITDMELPSRRPALRILGLAPLGLNAAWAEPPYFPKNCLQR